MSPLELPSLSHSAQVLSVFIPPPSHHPAFSRQGLLVFPFLQLRLLSRRKGDCFIQTMQPVSERERALTQVDLTAKSMLFVPLGSRSIFVNVCVAVSGAGDLFGQGHALSLLSPFSLLGDEHPTAHHLQEECHVLGRGREALQKGPGDCALQ